MRLTQSIVKLVESSCPRLAQEEITNRPKSKPGSPQEKGSYFETLCLGSGVQGQQTTSLPTLKKGTKSADQLRIEKQAERFKDMFDPFSPEFCGRTITEKQLVLTNGDREGTIDFVTDPLIVYDLKLTADINGYWGNLKEVDFLQQIHYQQLYLKERGILPEMRLLVFDYSTKMGVKEIRVNISDEAIRGYEERFDSVDLQLNEWGLLEEFPRVPSETSCVRCPLLCGKRVIKNNIIFEEITI